MVKSILTTKVITGGLLGTGTVVAGGVCIDQYIKSKNVSESSSEEQTSKEFQAPASGSPQASLPTAPSTLRSDSEDSTPKESPNLKPGQEQSVGN